MGSGKSASLGPLPEGTLNNRGAFRRTLLKGEGVATTASGQEYLPFCSEMKNHLSTAQHFTT